MHGGVNYRGMIDYYHIWTCAIIRSERCMGESTTHRGAQMPHLVQQHTGASRSHTCTEPRVGAPSPERKPGDGAVAGSRRGTGVGLWVDRGTRVVASCGGSGASRDPTREMECCCLELGPGLGGSRPVDGGGRKEGDQGGRGRQSVRRCYLESYRHHTTQGRSKARGWGEGTDLWGIVATKSLTHGSASLSPSSR